MLGVGGLVLSTSPEVCLGAQLVGTCEKPSLNLDNDERNDEYVG